MPSSIPGESPTPPTRGRSGRDHLIEKILGFAAENLTPIALTYPPQQSRWAAVDESLAVAFGPSLASPMFQTLGFDVRALSRGARLLPL